MEAPTLPRRDWAFHEVAESDLEAVFQLEMNHEAGDLLPRWLEMEHWQKDIARKRLSSRLKVFEEIEFPENQAQWEDIALKQRAFSLAGPRCVCLIEIDKEASEEALIESFRAFIKAKRPKRKSSPGPSKTRRLALLVIYRALKRGMQREEIKEGFKELWKCEAIRWPESALRPNQWAATLKEIEGDLAAEIEHRSKGYRISSDWGRMLLPEYRGKWTSYGNAYWSDADVIRSLPKASLEANGLGELS